LDAAVHAMVRRRSLLALVFGVALSGCAWLPFGGNTCPEITDTSAWVNRMPGPDQPAGGKLHVVVRLADDQSWKLSPVATGEEGLLVLALSAGGPSVPGTAAYQQSRKPLPQRIKIECHGKAVAFIDKITVAY
jgi:hypothetical protein